MPDEATAMPSDADNTQAADYQAVAHQNQSDAAGHDSGGHEATHIVFSDADGSGAPAAEAPATDEVVPDEANASMDPPSEQDAVSVTGAEGAGAEGDAEPEVDEADADVSVPDEVVPDEANASMDPPSEQDAVSVTDAALEQAQQPSADVIASSSTADGATPELGVAPIEHAPTAPQPEVAAEVEAASLSEGAPEPEVAPSRPRRRRAASRPAGPPVEVPASAEVPRTTIAAAQPAQPDNAAQHDNVESRGGVDIESTDTESTDTESTDAASSADTAAAADDATVYPDGAVVSQRRPTRRRGRTAQTEAPAADAQAELPTEATSDDSASTQARSAQGPESGRTSEQGQRSSRRRRSASRRQGPPEAVEASAGESGDDLAAAVARRVATAGTGDRAATGVAPDERDRKLQDLVAALSGGSDDDSDDESAVSDADEVGVDDSLAKVSASASARDDADESDDSDEVDDHATEGDAAEGDADADDRGGRRRRRRRGGRRRRRGGSEDEDSDESSDAADADEAETDADALASEGGEADSAASKVEASDDDSADEDAAEQGDGTRRRRRRRRRRGEDTSGADDDPSDVVVRVREPRSARSASDEVAGIEGSTRMEAKRQRRKEGRAAGRSRRPILSEAEFLSRREAVTRKMLIRQRDDYTQLAVLEDDVLVEHYVDRASATSLIGNIYLGRIQNVLPSMEAVFIDIGRGRNAVLYAGEVDWDSYGAVGDSKKVEQVFKSGQTVLVQVSKDPVGAKGARLTNHVSLPGRYVVYSPGGHLSGISRKLADTERHRLRDILGDLVSDDESVIVRTAAEGASEEELVRDVNRLKAQWEAIQKKIKQGSAPQLLYAEPDLTVRIVRDLFTEDFAELIVSGNGSAEDVYDNLDAYVTHVAPHLKDRLKRWDAESDGDIFAKFRIDEQIAKALERKVFLPSGGSLVIDRTEAMTVIDVNTGKFTGSGGNLEATVTSNNLEAAEEIVRQLRLRDIGGIIVVDFIDMVLPSNRELLLRRLVECLGRDRTRHQVAEVTSLGLVQMTRKKIGTGLAEAFTEQCDCCGGRGYVRHDEPVESQAPADGGERRSGQSTSRRGGRRRSSKGDN